MENLKKQVNQLTSSSPPGEALAILEALWHLKDASTPSLSLQEARESLAQGLKPNWASRQIIKSRKPFLIGLNSLDLEREPLSSVASVFDSEP